MIEATKLNGWIVEVVSQERWNFNVKEQLQSSLVEYRLQYKVSQEHWNFNIKQVVED